MLESSGVIEKGFSVVKNKLDSSFDKLTKLYGKSPYMDMIVEVFKSLSV